MLAALVFIALDGVCGSAYAATSYTLVDSCMLQRTDPHRYLVDVLRRVSAVSMTTAE